MTQKFIILSDISINKTIFYENIINLKIMPKINTKIPICIKLGNYNCTKIIYKLEEYIINNNNIIISKIENILKKLSNNINFDIITIEINSNTNIEYYDLPSYKLDNIIDNQLLALYEKYIQLDNIIIINNINNLISNCYNDLINDYNKENNTILIYYDDIDIDLNKYKIHFYIIDNNYNNFQKYLKSLNNEQNDNCMLLNEELPIIQILNKLYFDLDNYEELLKANYEEFFNNIYISKKYRHYKYYKSNNYNLVLTNYDEIKKDYSNNNELLEEYKKYENIINKSIEYFDDFFDLYIKKIEPEILKYFLIMYYNSKEYDEQYENNKDYEFNLMLKGLRKMCIILVKNKLIKNNIIKT